jgi:thiosulfate/3-mercaptopyruvate sulfurtransferase
MSRKRHFTIGTAALLLAGAVAFAAPGADEFAHPEFLMSVDELAAALDDPALVLIDARSAEDYAASHIPGAVSLPAPSLDHAETLANGNHVQRMVKPAEAIRDDYTGAGIDADSRVVIYDVGGSVLATRVWWTLDYYGHRNIAVLNGGLTAWENAGQSVTTEVPQVKSRGSFRPVPDPRKIADYDYVKARLGTDSTAICNALSEKSYSEAAIPTSHNLPQSTTFLELEETPVLKEAAELQTAFSALAVDKDREIIFYCGAGYAASQDYFVARLIGYTNVRNYDGSLRDWTARGGELLPSGGL